MTATALFSFAMVALLMVMTPGPNGVLILKTVAGAGRGAGFANIAGFAAAFFLHGTLAIFGLSALLVRSAELFFVVKMLGAAYLIFLGLKLFLQACKGAARLRAEEPVRRRLPIRRAVLEGFVTNALNPKVALFYLAVFPQFAGGGASIVETGYLLTATHALVNFLWFGSVILVLGRATSRVVASQRVTRWLQALSGAVFLWFGWHTATFRP